jgi:hypothetical protein
MSEEQPVTFIEEGVPLPEIAETVEELVEVYGGSVSGRLQLGRTFTLPLRRGVAAGGAVECSLTWSGEHDAGTVTLICNRNVDAPKAQRVLMLITGAAGALLFTIWPFFPQRQEFGALAWIGGAIAIAVYFMTLRKTSGGIALDFLQRLVEQLRDRDPEGGQASGEEVSPEV